MKEDPDDLFAMFGSKEDDGTIFEEFEKKLSALDENVETEKEVVESPEKAEEKESKKEVFIPENPFEKNDKSKTKKKQEKTIKKKAIKPRSKIDNFVRTMLRGSGQEELPSLSEMVGNLNGKLMKISDIGIFAEDEESENTILETMIEDCPVPNTVNVNSPIVISNVKNVGVSLLRSKLWHPIVVAKIKETGNVECISGRYRLVALAIIYGSSAKIPVYMYNNPISQAEGRDSIVYANKCRKKKAMEKASHVVLAAVNGGKATCDEVYENLAVNKKGMLDYVTFEVVENNYPISLNFRIAKFKGSRKDGKITTISGLRAFWGSALEWEKGMEREPLDKSLKLATEFLNIVVVELQKQCDFKPKHHMSIASLSALGMLFNSGEKQAEEIAKALVSLGECGNWKDNDIYDKILCKI